MRTIKTLSKLRSSIWGLRWAVGVPKLDYLRSRCSHFFCESADIIRKIFDNILSSGREWHNISILYYFVYEMHWIFHNIICNFLYYAPQGSYHKNSNTRRAMQQWIVPYPTYYECPIRYQVITISNKMILP